MLTSVGRLRAKIKTIGEKFEMRELHYKALLRSKDAEIQSLTAKYEEQRRMAENEAARCRALSSQVSTFSHTEAELRSQLNIYVEKFKQVRPEAGRFSICDSTPFRHPLLYTLLISAFRWRTL